MPYPEKRDLDYNYAGFSQSQGDNSFPGAFIDNDLASLKATTDEIDDFVRAVFTSGGVLQASSIPAVSDISVSVSTAQAAAASANAILLDVQSNAALAASSKIDAVAARSDAQLARDQAAGYAAQAQSIANLDLTPYATKAANLSDITSATAARTNLGLGALATLATLTTVDLANLTAAVQAMLLPTGAVQHFVSSTAPTGWVIANGATIGNAASGAARANADTAALFALIWALNATEYPIVTSAGAASTRGGSAAADYAAGKRLPLPDLRATFIRGLDGGRGIDSGRLLGSAQTEMIGPHTHTGVTDTEPAHTHTVTAYGAGSGGVIGNGATTVQNTSRATSSAGAHSHSLTIDNNTGTENRPRNTALLACVKL